MWFVPDPIVLAPATRAILGKKMELYAGMVENMDYHVGRLIDHLKQIGEYENTIFIVFGDNGAEGTDLFKMIAGTPGTRDYLFAAINWSQTNPNAWGDPGSYVGYGPMWAQVSMTPFSQYKGWLGRRRHPQRAHRQRPARQAAHGQHQPRPDVRRRHHADTARDCGHDQYPKARDGHELPPLTGKSWGTVLERSGRIRRATDQDVIAWEIFGNHALRQGDWKLRWQYTPFGKSDWELFNVAADPVERHDLAAQHPDKVKALVALWDAYVRGQQRHPAEPVGLRDHGRPVAAACAGRPGLPAADLQAAVRAAARNGGGAQALST